MNGRAKGVIAGMSGLLAGGLATQLVTWPALPKACLGAGVCVVVSAILLLVLPRRYLFRR